MTSFGFYYSSGTLVLHSAGERLACFLTEFLKEYLEFFLIEVFMKRRFDELKRLDGLVKFNFISV